MNWEIYHGARNYLRNLDNKKLHLIERTIKLTAKCATFCRLVLMGVCLRGNFGESRIRA